MIPSEANIMVMSVSAVSCLWTDWLGVLIPTGAAVVSVHNKLLYVVKG